MTTPWLNWNEIAWKPTTVAGYGITDCPTITSMNAAISAALASYEPAAAVAPAIAAAQPSPALITARTSAGAVTLTGAALGATVQKVFDLTSPADVSSDFEATISVAGEIQQSTGLGAADKCLVFLVP